MDFSRYGLKLVVASIAFWCASSWGLKEDETRYRALQDPENRIQESFSVPEPMQERVRFWFDIYTRYGNHHHVIHHTLYPWIVFEVVETSRFLDGKGPRWLQITRGEKFVKQRRAEIRKALKALATRGRAKKGNKLEASLENVLALVPGQRRKVFQEAAGAVRVQLGQRDFFLSGLNNSEKYMDHMELEFQRQGLPTELLRIPFVESSFNEKAHSRVGASGIWQIMPSVGRHYMIVNRHIDERNSPLKATVVAGKLLKLNYKILGQWPLAVTAYNHGAAGVQRALKAAQAEDLPELIERYHRGSFKFASANFYACFLATLHAEKYHQEIFSGNEILPKEPWQLRDLRLTSPTRVRTLTAKFSVDRSQIEALNIDLKNAWKVNAKLPRQFRLFLPAVAGEKQAKLGDNDVPKAAKTSAN